MKGLIHKHQQDAAWIHHRLVMDLTLGIECIKTISDLCTHGGCDRRRPAWWPKHDPLPTSKQYLMDRRIERATNSAGRVVAIPSTLAREVVNIKLMKDQSNVKFGWRKLDSIPAEIIRRCFRSVKWNQFALQRYPTWPMNDQRALDYNSHLGPIIEKYWTKGADDCRQFVDHKTRKKSRRRRKVLALDVSSMQRRAFFREDLCWWAEFGHLFGRTTEIQQNAWNPKQLCVMMLQRRIHSLTAISESSGRPPPLKYSFFFSFLFEIKGDFSIPFNREWRLYVSTISSE